MEKENFYDIMNNNPRFYLATVQGDQPRVRGMLLYRADEDGILFHTSTLKDLYTQLCENPKAELCFADSKTNMQVRVAGTLELVEDGALKEEMLNHPSRAFMRQWVTPENKDAFMKTLAVFRMKNGIAKTWTMETNFEHAPEIKL